MTKGRDWHAYYKETPNIRCSACKRSYYEIGHDGEGFWSLRSPEPGVPWSEVVSELKREYNRLLIKLKDYRWHAQPGQYYFHIFAKKLKIFCMVSIHSRQEWIIQNMHQNKIVGCWPGHSVPSFESLELHIDYLFARTFRKKPYLN
jgi:hypothetical protein